MLNSARMPSQQQKEQEQQQQQEQETAAGDHKAPTMATAGSPSAAAVVESEYFDLNVLKGAVSFNTKPFKHRALVWIGFKKVLLFPLCWDWWFTRISRVRFFVGCTLYLLHNACAWLYIRGSLLQHPGTLPALGGQGADDNHVTHIEILLPYMIGALFGVGYGSVVAAGGWEALRVPVNANGAVAAGSEAAAAGERRGSIGGGAGDVGAAGDLHGTSSDISFAAQVCARDTRAEQEAHAQIDEDDDEDFESSGASSDNDDDIHVEERPGGGGGGVDPQVTVAAATQPATRTTAVTRSQTRTAGSTNDSDVGDSGAEARRGSDPVRFEGGEDERAAPDARHPLLPGREGVGDSVPPTAGLSLVHQASSYDSTEGEDDEEEEEDRGGWGQVVVKPVKVARWDKQGQRSKAQLSLNQLRALILERAESTPQRVTYRRAARLGVAATVCLPAVFTLCTMIACAWSNADAECATDVPAPDHAFADIREGKVGRVGGCRNGNPDISLEDDGRLELETMALAALLRAGRAMWALVLRVLQPAAGDGAAAAVAVISLCSVAFVALPTFWALEDAERTYQRRYMYSKYFCALTSSQRARKHRLPHFSLKNVANIRVWLALRAGKTWLRRHRRERSADAVVSSAFFLSLALLAAILAEAISREARFLSTLVHWELLVWCCFISFFLLRYLTLGSNTNNRYRDTSVLLTEQINVQLRILQNSTRAATNKASKRERLVVSSNVLKLATKLLKELDGPNKLSGLSMNPVLYNVTRVVLVSALSGVMSDTLGFSVKLWKVISFK